MNQEILEKKAGLFGDISVGKTLTPSTFWLKINEQIEGQVFSDQQGLPGRISASRYLYGFIIPAWHFPKSEMLMLGLGSGAGAVMLLSLFPELKLKIVEIDPVIIDLSRTHFPLISFYEKQNRLTIIKQEAASYLQTCHEQFSFILLDLFTGNENNQYNLELLNQSQNIAPYFMANIITEKKIISKKIEDFLWIASSPSLPREKKNWLITNMQHFSPKIGESDLFHLPSEKKQAIQAANQYFQYILSQIPAAYFYN